VSCFNGKTVTMTEAMPTATAGMNFVDPPHVGKSGLMMKINNYIPPMKEELEQQVIIVDTWQRESLFPKFFYDYFIKTFMIPAYTCAPTQYAGLTDPRACYCNGGDYHSMPTLNIDATNEGQQYDIEPSSYMFEPYLTAEVMPTTLCIFGIYYNSQLTSSGQQEILLGQRVMSTFPYFIVYDRDNNQSFAQLGNAVESESGGGNTVEITVSCCVVAVLFGLLVYLIYLRRARIKAEEWLELNKNLLFSQNAHLKTEEEILEALVKSKELKDKMLLTAQNANGAQITAATQQSVLSQSVGDSKNQLLGTP